MHSIIAQDRIIGITGGPGTGKSSILEVLKEKGFQVIPEAYTSLYTQAKNDNKLTEFFADPVKLRSNLIEKQIEREDARNKTKPTISDRTVLDPIFFGELYNIKMPSQLYEKAENRRYDLIFFLEPLPIEFYKTTEIRKRV